MYNLSPHSRPNESDCALLKDSQYMMESLGTLFLSHLDNFHTSQFGVPILIVAHNLLLES